MLHVLVHSANKEPNSVADLGHDRAGGLALVLGQPVLVVVGASRAARLGTRAGRALMDHA